ncbi:unnamed protein product, partial [Amoebophrya sp. A120]
LAAGILEIRAVPMDLIDLSALKVKIENNKTTKTSRATIHEEYFAERVFRTAAPFYGAASVKVNFDKFDPTACHCLERSAAAGKDWKRKWAQKREVYGRRKWRDEEVIKFVQRATQDETYIQGQSDNPFEGVGRLPALFKKQSMENAIAESRHYDVERIRALIEEQDNRARGIIVPKAKASFGKTGPPPRVRGSSSDLGAEQEAKTQKTSLFSQRQKVVPDDGRSSVRKRPPPAASSSPDARSARRDDDFYRNEETGVLPKKPKLATPTEITARKEDVPQELQSKRKKNSEVVVQQVKLPAVLESTRDRASPARPPKAAKERRSRSRTPKARKKRSSSRARTPATERSRSGGRRKKDRKRDSSRKRDHHASPRQRNDESRERRRSRGRT